MPFLAARYHAVTPSWQLARLLLGLRPAPHGSAMRDGTFLYLLWLVIGLGCCAVEVSVDGDVGLLRALEGDADTILVTSDITIPKDWGGYTSNNPLVINRNVTVRSVPPLRVIDFQFLQHLVRLEPGVTLSLQDFVFSHSRYGSGVQMLDILSASPNSVLGLTGVATRLACVPNQTALGRLLGAARPAAFPGEQRAAPLETPLCLRGRCYTEGVVHQDIVLQPTLTEEPNAGGYIVVLQNLTRTCGHVVSQQCMQTLGGDACVRQYIDSATDLATPGKGYSSAQQQQQQDDQRSQSPVIAGVVVGVVLVLGALFGLWMWHQRRLRRLQGFAGLEMVITDGGPQQSGLLLPEDFLKGQADSVPTSSSWEITAAHTSSDCLGSTGEGTTSSGQRSADMLNAVQLGLLLGAGSFGRVYKGRWMGRTVAVKVLQHSAKSAELVLNEVNLMLSFKHPNVVRAYHVINWAHKRRPGEGTRRGEPPGGSTLSGQPSTPTQPTGGTSNTAGSSREVNAFEEAQTWIVAEYCDSGNLADMYLSRGASGAQQVRQAQPGVLAAEVLPAGQSPYQDPSSTLQPSSSQPLPSSSVSQGYLSSDQQLPKPQSPVSAPESQQAQATPEQQQEQPPQQQQQQQEQPPQHQQQQEQPRQLQEQPLQQQQEQEQEQEQPPQQQQQELSQAPAEQPARALGAVSELEPAGGSTGGSEHSGHSEHSGSHKPIDMMRLLCRLREVARAMLYLHARNVVHGDLKVANVLLATDPTAPFGKTAKVTDFGLSRALQVGQTHRSTRTLGTVSHMAPELLRLGRMSSAADVYAFGIMMWELVTGQPAFADMHYGEVVERVGIHAERPPVPSDVPQDYAFLMRSCWAELPLVRPSFTQVEQCVATMIAIREQPSTEESWTRAVQQLQQEMSEFGPCDL